METKEPVIQEEESIKAVTTVPVGGETLVSTGLGIDVITTCDETVVTVDTSVPNVLIDSSIDTEAMPVKTFSVNVGIEPTEQQLEILVEKFETAGEVVSVEQPFNAETSLDEIREKLFEPLGEESDLEDDEDEDDEDDEEPTLPGSMYESIDEIPLLDGSIYLAIKKGNVLESCKGDDETKEITIGLRLHNSDIETHTFGAKYEQAREYWFNEGLPRSEFMDVELEYNPKKVARRNKKKTPDAIQNARRAQTKKLINRKRNKSAAKSRKNNRK